MMFTVLPQTDGTDKTAVFCLMEPHPESQLSPTICVSQQALGKMFQAMVGSTSSTNCTDGRRVFKCLQLTTQGVSN